MYLMDDSLVTPIHTSKTSGHADNDSEKLWVWALMS